MKAVVEEGDETLAARMQHLALSEAALPRHLLTAFYTKKPAGLKLIYVSPYLNTFKILIIIIQDLLEMAVFYLTANCHGSWLHYGHPTTQKR